MKRRHFLGIVAGAAAAASALTLSRGVFSSVPRQAMGALASMLQSPSQRLARHYSYLTLDPQGLDAFVGDYERHYLRSLRFRPWRTDVHLRYLMSTDYFRNGGDRSRIVRYVAFYDPYITPCNNPLARFDE